MRAPQRVVAVTLCIGLLSACSPKLDDLRTYTEQVKQTTQVSIEPYPEFAEQPAFVYSAQDLRSPFVRPRNKQAQAEVVQKANCLQPDFSREKEKLEEYGLDALSLSGSFTSQGKRWALFKTNDGGLYKATIGSHVGLFHGEVKSVSQNEVVIEQLLPDGAGCWQRKETTLTQASAAGENGNV